MFGWVWSYFTFDVGVRLITEAGQINSHQDNRAKLYTRKVGCSGRQRRISRAPRPPSFSSTPSSKFGPPRHRALVAHFMVQAAPGEPEQRRLALAEPRLGKLGKTLPRDI
jgi:hypothetical protein